MSRGLAWRSSRRPRRVTGWCAWWLAWACRNRGGYGCCIVFTVPGTLMGTRDGLVWQALRALAFGAPGDTVRPPARRTQTARRPSAAAVQAEAANHRELLRSRAVVVSV